MHMPAPPQVVLMTSVCMRPIAAQTSGHTLQLLQLLAMVAQWRCFPGLLLIRYSALAPGGMRCTRQISHILSIAYSYLLLSFWFQASSSPTSSISHVLSLQAW